MKIGVTADIHFHNWSDYATINEDGFNSRLISIGESLMWNAKDSLERGAKAFVIAGDLFHSRKHIEPSVLYYATQIIQEISSLFNGDLYILEGNHDMSVTGETSNSILQYESCAKIISKNCIKVIDGKKVGFLPYTNDTAILSQFADKLVKKNVKYWVAHVGLDGAKATPSDFEVPGGVHLTHLNSEKFEWILLGHYHKQQSVLPNVWYVGSPIQHTWGETTEPKGYMLATSKTAKFIKNPNCPKFISYNTDDETIPEIRDIDYVKVRGSDKEKIQKATKRIKEKVKDVKTQTVYIPEITYTARTKLAGMSTKKMLKTFIEKHSVPVAKTFDVEEYLAVGLDALTEAGI